MKRRAVASVGWCYPYQLLEECGLDEPLFRTNPVWCLARLADHAVPRDQLAQIAQRLLEEGVFLPEAACRQYLSAEAFETISGRPIDSCPRVVGLLCEPTNGAGFVTPLVAELSTCWHVVPNLPFTVEQLQQLLTHLLISAEINLGELCPELYCARVEDRLGRKAFGSSMTVSGVLAVLDAVTDHRHAPFRSACAIVESAEYRTLRPVDRIGEKLQAFRREFQRGSLLIRHCLCTESIAQDETFDTVWSVETLDELARYLEDSGLLEPFRQRAPLNRHKLQIALERVHLLSQHQARYRDALRLSERLSRHPFADDVPPAKHQEIRRHVSALYRHLGRYQDATRTAKAAMMDARRGGHGTSYDRQARTAAEYAAALYDPHRFEEMIQVLEPWREKLVDDPLMALPLTRVAVFNTLGRAQVVRHQPGWQDNFSRSLAVLSATEPYDQPRTLNYQIHALLRSNRLRDAEKQIGRVETMAMSDFSRWHLRFAQAELARRRAETWQHAEMDRQAVATCSVGHPFGFYYQATARQRGRMPEDAAERFRRAEQFFRRDLECRDTANIQVFLAACMRLAAAAWLDEAASWQEAVQSLQEYASHRTRRSLKMHYSGVLPLYGSLPSVSATEAMLLRVPYF